MLTPREVAEILRVDVSTVHRMIERGDLRAVQLGKRGSSVRIPLRELERYGFGGKAP